MSPILLHIYGPFAIHSFGTMIVIGLLITLYLLQQDKPLHKLITNDQLASIVQLSFFAGIAGGRTWFLITNPLIVTNWIDLVAIWSGGLSILGAVIAVLLTLSLYFYMKKIPRLPVLDRLSLYAPLLQSISRFGCFFAGCCYGKVTDLPWGIVYKNPDSLAPLHVVIHPTQIYSSLFLASIFLILLYFDRYYTPKKSGQILALYIMLMSFERFFIDFLRGDQEFFIIKLFGKISAQQILASFLFIAGFLCMLFVTIYAQTSKKRL